jgi:hypothetical protein
VLPDQSWALAKCHTQSLTTDTRSKYLCGYDSLIQGPFAKVSSLYSSIQLKFLPPDYVSFHCLSSYYHVFGSSFIIEASLNASLCSFGLSNNCCGINLPKTYFYSPTTVDRPFLVFFLTWPTFSITFLIGKKRLLSLALTAKQKINSGTCRPYTPYRCWLLS